MDYDLDRFVAAQEDVHERALDELRRGRKESHWMWFIFPQLAGLGRSSTSVRYAVASLDEARAYLAHPLLGHRLRECSAQVLASNAPTAGHIFGSIDARKLHSSMTLFHRAAPDDAVFSRVLERYFDGVPDEATDTLLG